MGRKVFISVLGTNHYVEARYYCGLKQTGKELVTRFVQEQLISNICKQWGREDRIFMLLTEDAKKNNWKSPAQKGNKKGEYIGLEEIVASIGLNCKCEEIPIPDGFSELEIWEIFEETFSRLNECDEIYFDITHAFRSIPMLIMVLINYAKFLKNVEIKSISYGAFEKLGPAYKVENEIDVENRFVPITELISFSALQDWTNAANNFISLGNADKLYELAKNDIKPFAVEYKGANESFNSLNQVINKLPDFISNIETCRGIDIVTNNLGALLNKNLDNINEQFISPLNPILKKIEEKIYPFKNENNLINGFNAVRWCIDNNLIQQGFTILQENMISLILDEVQLETESLINRNIISAAYKICTNNILEKDWKGDAREHPSITMKILSESSLINILAKDYSIITDLRNDMNHSGYRNNPVSAKKLKSILSERYCSVLSKVNLLS